MSMRMGNGNGYANRDGDESGAGNVDGAGIIEEGQAVGPWRRGVGHQ